MILGITVEHDGFVEQIMPDDVPLGVYKIEWNIDTKSSFGVVSQTPCGKRVFMTTNWTYGIESNHVLLEKFANTIKKLTKIDLNVKEKPITPNDFLEKLSNEYTIDPNPYTLGRLSATQEICLM